MPEVIIKYKNYKALQALKDFAKHFDFVISLSRSKERESINGITIIPANNSINITGLKKVFTGKNIAGKELRSKTWQRKNNL